MKAPVMLMILDGFGLGSPDPGNAIELAKKPVFDKLWHKYPTTMLHTSGERVGLPNGQMGNSEVGHLNLGSGRVVYQEFTRITKAVETGDIFRNQELLKVIHQVRAKGTALHLLGLVSDGGVHSHMEHLYALLAMAKQEGLTRVYIHAFLDGRDVPPASGLQYIKELEEKCKNLGIGQIATVMGRYWGMDRDKRWERTAKAYNAMALGEGIKATMAVMAVEQSYDMKVTDEFVEPSVVVDKDGQPVGMVQSGDGMIHFNFRSDRARQTTRAFVDQDFIGFERAGGKIDVSYCCLTQYDATIQAPIAFPPQNLDNTLGQVLSANGLKQLRIAETEKYAHVTFFFNGGVEVPNQGEDRILIDSPKVATYNMQPEMSAGEVTEQVLDQLDKHIYDVIILNYANPDMVGHTGDLPAAIKAIEFVDLCVGKVVDKMLALNGHVLLTSDHGNAEQMTDDENKPHTAHTNNLVPFILISNTYDKVQLMSNKALEDVAPTILDILSIPKPEEMTGNSLIKG